MRAQNRLNNPYPEPQYPTPPKMSSEFEKRLYEAFSKAIKNASEPGTYKSDTKLDSGKDTPSRKAKQSDTSASTGSKVNDDTKKKEQALEDAIAATFKAAKKVNIHMYTYSLDTNDDDFEAPGVEPLAEELHDCFIAMSVIPGGWSKVDNKLKEKYPVWFQQLMQRFDDGFRMNALLRRFVRNFMG